MFHASGLFSILFLVSSGSAFTKFGASVSHVRTWRELEVDAGYYSSKGTWLGGLPNSRRSNFSALYHCRLFDSDTDLCIEWSGSYAGREPITEFQCSCLQRDVVCKEWQCTARPRNHGCGAADIQETRHTCRCDQVRGQESGYCAGWSCREEKAVNGDSAEIYQCMDTGDGTMCRRWRGEIRTEHRIQSVVCAFPKLREGNDWDSWTCEGKSLGRCQTSGFGWCDMWVTLGIYGTFALLLFFVLVRMVLSGLRTWSWKLKGIMFFVCFVTFVCPWTFPIVIGIGFRGGGWFLVMLGIAIGVSTYLASVQGNSPPV